MKQWRWAIAAFGLFLLVFPGALSAQPIVTFQAGLLSVQCANAPLSEVFEAIEDAAGIEMTLEDPVKSKRLTANLNAVPVGMAVQRLLEGAGVNYIVMMDPADWGRVAKIFVGAGGGGPARPLPPARPEPEPVEEPYDNYDPALEDPTLENFEDPGAAGLVGENPEPMDPGAFPTQPGASPIPNFFPPSQSFPRSNFTPGPPNQPQPYMGPGTQQPQQQGQNPAAPTFPFMDPFGRPIPVPPNLIQQQQQQQQQQRQQQQQQQ